MSTTVTGYGAVAGAAAQKALPAGSFFTPSQQVSPTLQNQGGAVLVYHPPETAPTDPRFYQASEAAAAK